jgi:pyruvate/2-oxoglutarate dehydrogenase complex dihydrolipoamide acyltransferase (E2) component
LAKVTMPQLGESVAEGTIGKWLKQPGDKVAKYEPLLEVITDKVNAEVPSPFEGTLTQILVQEGETVPNNAEIAVIETADGTAAHTAQPAEVAAESHGPAGSDERPEHPPAPATPAQAPAPALAATPASLAPSASAGVAGAASAGAASAAAPGSPDARMTPAVRRLLREHGLEAAMIVGSGGGGRITREDVTDFVEAQRTGQPVGRQAPVAAGAATSPTTSRSPAPALPPSSRGTPTAPTANVVFPPGADEVLVPMTQMRRGIAAQMTRALAVPHAYVSMEVDATSLVRFREGAKRDFEAREGLSLSYVPLVAKACVEGLKRHPQFNAHWTEQGLLAKRRVNIGVAVAVDDGLLVPVIRDVDQLSIAALTRAIVDVANRARVGKLRLDDFGGGTFTLDNTGYLGSNMTMPIINVPEVAIMTMEAITKRAVVVETPQGDSIAVRPVMNLVLGIDHRANDGAGAAAFLRTVKGWLEAVGPDLSLY